MKERLFAATLAAVTVAPFTAPGQILDTAAVNDMSSILRLLHLKMVACGVEMPGGSLVDSRGPDGDSDETTGELYYHGFSSTEHQDCVAVALAEISKVTSCRVSRRLPDPTAGERNYRSTAGARVVCNNAQRRALKAERGSS